MSSVKVAWAKNSRRLPEIWLCIFSCNRWAAQVLAEKIKSVDNVYLKKFGSPEAIWELTVDEFPVVVTMDAHGGSLHEVVQNSSENQLKKELK